MNIDKFIDDNLDEILDNPAFFISAEQNTEKDKVVNIYEGEDIEEQDNSIDFLDIHEMFERKKEISNQEKKQDINNEDHEYYFKLINIFMKYYNDKFNKNENLFSNVKDKNKDTNSALELFFEAIMEFKDLKEKLNIDGVDDSSRASTYIDDSSRASTYIDDSSRASTYIDDSSRASISVDDSSRASTYIDDSSRASTYIDELDLLDKYYDSDSEEIVNLMNSYKQVYCLEINEGKKKIITISLIICLNYVLINKIEKWNIFMLKSY
jgi:hypothetical protein